MKSKLKSMTIPLANALTMRTSADIPNIITMITDVLIVLPECCGNAPASMAWG